MSVSVFNYLDYKKYIEDEVKDLGEPWGYWGQLAKAINCQPAYLSRCLKDKTHLTVDQILALSRFWSLSANETDYLVYLLEMDRAGSKENREFFLKKLKALKEENQNLKTRLKKDSFEKIQDQALYYSSWLWMAVHFATSIESLQSLEELSKRFSISTEHTRFILEKLLELGLVNKDGNKWTFLSGEFHLGKESPLIASHHQNWRSKAVADSQNPMSDGVHYSAVHTLSKKDFERLKANLLKFIDESREIINPSPEEEIICLNLDIFRL
jgi:uncharacterized protein (TIGR02147 family)